MNIDAYLDESHGIHRYLMAQKAAGRIRHLGFSAHGSLGVIWRFLEAYGGDMEFCQLQLNYLDWTFQDGKAKVELLREWNIPVWVMEPLRGGQLARITPEEAAPLTALRPGETASSWAFRFLQSLPDVVVTLSGMSNLSQLKENIATFGEEKPLTPQEWEALMEVTQGMLGKYVLPCTACRYCVSHCPQGLDIPTLLALYNEHRLSGGGFIAPMALMASPEEKKGYDQKRLCRVTGGGRAVLTALLAVMTIWEDVLPAAFAKVFGAVTVGVVVVILVLSNTICRRKP